MCLIRVRAKLCRNNPDLRIPGLNCVSEKVKCEEVMMGLGVNLRQPVARSCG